MLKLNMRAEYFFTQEEERIVHEAVVDCEKDNHGEVRVYVESKCSMVDPLDRAAQIFRQYKMHETTVRNAVLIYIAYKHKEFAIYADDDAIEKFPKAFWATQAKYLSQKFASGEKVSGIVEVLGKIKEQFNIHYFGNPTNKNHLPDEIIFGK